MQRENILSWLHNISLGLSGLALLFFPLVFLTITTDPFGIPKQALLGIVSLLGLLLLSLKFAVEGKVKVRRTPFDLPVLLFLIALLASSLLSLNRADALSAFIPVLFAGIFFFVATNLASDKTSSRFLTSSFVAGAVILAIVVSLSYFKIYILPFQETHAQTFTPLGTLFDTAIYLAVAFFLCLQKALPVLKRHRGSESIAMTVAGAASLVGFLVAAVALVNLAKPQILPFQTGFQTAFAEISQDAGRLVLGFFTGSGYGTYLTDFTRFKPAVYNQSRELWSILFIRSSSYALELLATTGILGIASFLFFIYRAIRKGKSLPLFLIIVASFVLPFSSSIVTLLFFLLALSAVNIGAEEKNQDFFDIEVGLIALRHGVLAIVSPNARGESRIKALPAIFLVVVVILVGLLSFYSTKYIVSDANFQKSLVAASRNNGSQTYTLQQSAIRDFPYRDVYFRVFSQTNFALANSLAASVPKGSSPSAQVQSGIVTLTQQSINAGRQATTLSPLTSINWQSLSGIYRGLFGFGQNAEAFAVQTMQQAIILDPNNPQLYVNLGGIYYQLARYDDAQQQFQIAISLKPDYANAYYNLAQALKQKKQLKEALAQLETAKNLVGNDKANQDIVNKEIEALKQQIATGASAQPPVETGTQTSLPPQNPPVKIPSPPTSQRGEPSSTQSAK